MYKSVVIGKGGIEARVVADSIANGVRLTTIELRFHRFILPEFNTHRMFSRNFSSSRAIPVTKMIEQVENDPAMPIHWGKNQPGMQAREELVGFDKAAVMVDWEKARDSAVKVAKDSNSQGAHKQIVNRLLEPFQFVKGVVTATEWDNFFKLRDHEAAQPEIQELARCMKQAMEESEPDELDVGQWHLPYVEDPTKTIQNEYNLKEAIKMSVARCARVSYMKHDNTSPSIEDDIDLYNALVTRPYTMKNGMYLPENDPIHASPAEHQATPMKWARENTYIDVYNVFEMVDDWDEGTTHMDKEGHLWSGNFKSWVQYRKLIEDGQSV